MAIFYPNAKINIGLNIVEKRADGYHNIETIFYPIPLRDVLKIKPQKKGLETSLEVLNFEECEDNITDNLVFKAYRLLQEKYPLHEVCMMLEKNIPTGAGLGGGSADAAFTLKILNKLFRLNIPINELEILATTLGADCSFFIRNKPAYATGIGNILTPLNLFLRGYHLLLVKPDVHVSTPNAYSNIVPQPSSTTLYEDIKRPIGEWKKYIKNDFEPSVFNQYPDIALIKEKMYKIGAAYASMSGSGATVYGIFEKPIKNKKIFQPDTCFSFTI